MPITTVPLVLPYSTRPGPTFTSTLKDQRAVGAYSEFVEGVGNSASPYLTKRPGLQTNSTIVSSKQSLGFCVSDDGRFCFVFSDGTVYFKNNNAASAVSVGSLSPGSPTYITQAFISGETYFLISDGGSGGCYYLTASAGNDSSPTFTATTVNGSPILTNVSSTTNVFVGQALSGAGIPAGARVQSIDSATQITMTAAATASAGPVTITFTQLAKIISSAFPSSVAGAFAFLGGFAFIMSSDGKIYNSAINNINSWSANDYIPGTQTGSLSGNGQGVVRVKDRIFGMYSGSNELFYNAGNPSNSPLSRVANSLSNIGIYDFATCGDYVFFMGAPAGEQLVNCYIMSEAGVKEISPPPVSRNISQGMGTPSAAFLSGGRMAGLDFFFLQYTSFSVSWMYCVQTNKWFETGLAANYLFSGGPLSGGLYAVSLADSVLYKVNSSIYQDGGVAFTMVSQTQPYVLNKGKAFTIRSVELLADNQSSGSTTLKISGDDYANFTTIGSFDLTSTRKRLYRCGYYKNHAIFKLEDAGNNAWRGQALIVDWEPCTT